MCGATKKNAQTRRHGGGLSPRVRGNPARGGVAESATGPIPACAGQPGCRGALGLALWAYPRVCGATSPMARSAALCTGLSPRVRGNLDFGQHLGPRVGPIPACAGQPFPAPPDWCYARAYPRVCGATLRLKREGAIRQGLSPRVRGNLVAGVKWRDFVGPIPACAGQPGQQESCAGNHRAYPRVCGATGTWTAIGPASRGLSPRVRGNLRDLQLKAGRPGPIPACAGQPRAVHVGNVLARAYPRVCGATSSFVMRRFSIWGLSPRVRGNRTLPTGATKGKGPIPACAGQPWPAPALAGLCRAYPRVCGATAGVVRCSA